MRAGAAAMLLACPCLLGGCGLVLDLDERGAPDAAAPLDARLPGGDAGPGGDTGPPPRDAGRCGDGEVGPGEQCDDANGVEDDGCRSDCTFTCTEDSGCAAADACTSAFCDPSTHVCRPGPALPCRPPSECESFIGCDPVEGCLYEPLAEICDGADQDCDGRIDEGSGTPCAADRDGDGFGDPLDVIWSCDGSCEPGRVTNTGDCWDEDPAGLSPPPWLAYPGHRVPFREPRGDGSGSYDWNCDGVEEPRWRSPYSGDCHARLGPCASQSGWGSMGVAPCGERREYLDCQNDAGGACRLVVRMETQACF